VAKILELLTVNVAVKDLNAGLAKWRALGLSPIRPMVMPELPAAITDVTFPMGQEGSVSVIAGIGDRSPLNRFLEKRGEGVYSIAVRVDDLHGVMKEWPGMDWVLKEPYEFPNPNQAARYLPDKLLVNWIKPNSLHGVMLECFEFVGEVRETPKA
jgi:methylmalonyl-CoA/ethylmalonyl-CoA epimerase